MKNINSNIFIIYYLYTNQYFFRTNMITFTFEQLKNIIENETYAMIESISDEDSNNSESILEENFLRLDHLLLRAKLPHCQIIGCYEGITTKYSFFVVKPANMNLSAFHRTIYNLGCEFKQESVIFSTASQISLVFTSGVHKNKVLRGKGFNDNIGKNFSKIETSDNKTYFIGEYYLDRDSYFDWSNDI